MIKNEQAIIKLFVQDTQFENTNPSSLSNVVHFELASDESIAAFDDNTGRSIADDIFFTFGRHLRSTTPLRKFASDKRKVNCWRGYMIVLPNGVAYRFAVTWQHIHNNETFTSNVKYGAPTKVERGKNIGKANETSPKQQAWLDLCSKYDKKVTEGYDIEPKEVWKPMLAQTYKPNTPRIAKYLGEEQKAYIQPKLDGIRATWRSTSHAEHPQSGVLLSRENKVHAGPKDCPGFYNHLKAIEQAYREATGYTDFVLDIELKLPSCYPFEYTTRAVKKYGLVPKLDCIKYKDLPGAPQIEYNLKYYEDHELEFVTDKLVCNVLDVNVVDHPDLTYGERYLSVIRETFSFISNYYSGTMDNANHLANVTHFAHSDSFETYLTHFMEQGHEGAMVRTLAGKYEADKRSYQLWKYKQFEDAEFRLVAMFPSDQGATLDCAMFVLETEEGKTFEATPKMSHEERRYLWRQYQKDPSIYQGKMWVIQYQNMTYENVPRSPVAVRERDYE